MANIQDLIDIVMHMSAVTEEHIAIIEELRARLEECCADLDYLTFTSRENGSWISADLMGGVHPALYYTRDNGRTWTDWTAEGYQMIYVNEGEEVKMYGENPNGLSFSESVYFKFKLGGKFDLSRNVMSLVSSSLPTEIPNAYCFYSLFEGNMASVLSAPETPATVLKPHCYELMFCHCDSMITSPSIIPADIIPDCACNEMFEKDVSLETTPELPARKIGSHGYSYMFAVTNITDAPILTADTISDYCYECMFIECRRLVNLQQSELPATEIAEGCYRGMFASCTSLEDSLRLPATIMKPYCYAYMFQNTSVNEAVPLVSTQLAEGCYMSMFDNTNIDEAPELPATVLANHCYNRMFNNTRISEIPDLRATQMKPYCYSGMFAGCENLTHVPEFAAVVLAESCFSYMYSNCTNLVSAPQLPYTTLYRQCYTGMFLGCSSLTTAPALPAENLEYMCYASMFVNSGIRACPVLSSTTLAYACYQEMFAGCLNISTMPDLPATTVPEHAYSYMFSGSTVGGDVVLPATAVSTYSYMHMFYGCVNVTSARVMSTQETGQWSYLGMFGNCINLSVIHKAGTSYIGGNLYLQWVENVSGIGTFYMENGTPYESGVNGVPSSWNIQYE